MPEHDHRTSETTGKGIKPGCIVGTIMMILIAIPMMKFAHSCYSGCSKAVYKAYNWEQELKLAKSPTYVDVSYNSLLESRGPVKYIIGTVRNLSSKYRYDWVNLVFKIRDKNWTNIGTVTVIIDHLDPGEVRKFKEPVFEEEAFSVELEDKELFPDMESLRERVEW